MKKLSRNQWIAVAVALVVVFWFFAWNSMSISLFGKRDDSMMENRMDSNNISKGDGLIIEDIAVGTGAEAVSGKTVTVHYKGTFMDGKLFDSSFGRPPFTFVLGQQMVIKGWDEGVAGMKVGGKRRLTIPSDLAYGPQEIRDGAGNVVIPANATLIFEVELLDVK